MSESSGIERPEDRHLIVGQTFAGKRAAAERWINEKLEAGETVIDCRDGGLGVRGVGAARDVTPRPKLLRRPKRVKSD